MYYKGKQINSFLYTKGKFGKGFRETVDTENPFLYSNGTYKTKLTEEDLPESYIPIFSRSIWYMNGFLQTAGIKDIKYKWVKENHLFKDDYLYVSYKELMTPVISRFGISDFIGYDVSICGNSIVDIVLAAEKYSSVDASEVRKEIQNKFEWLSENEPEYFATLSFKKGNIFDQWIEKGYVLNRLI